MTAPSLDAALAKLDLAYGTLTLPDWQAHTEALADAVEGLTQVLMHVDALTGIHHEEPIYRDPTRVVLGMIPEVMAPLIRLLQRQSRQLDVALENGWLLPPTEGPAWLHWHLRLARYQQSLNRELAKPYEPSESLWTEVTAPLLQGIYPEDFGAIGIANPKVPSKPDVATVPTTAFMIALQSEEVSQVQTWLLSWREGLTLWLHETREAIQARFASLGEGVRSGARRVVGVLAVIGVIGGLGWLGWKFSNSNSAKASRPRLRETS